MSLTVPGPGPSDGGSRKSKKFTQLNFEEKHVETAISGSSIKIKIPLSFFDLLGKLSSLKLDDSEVPDRVISLLRNFDDLRYRTSGIYYRQPAKDIFSLDLRKQDTSELYLPVIENFSGITLGFSDEYKSDLKNHVLSYSFGNWENTDSEEGFLNSGLYLIVKLSVIEASLIEQEKIGSLPERVEHLDLLDKLRSVIIYGLTEEYEFTNLPVYPRNYFADKLSDIASKNSDISKALSKISACWEDVAIFGKEILEEVQRINDSRQSPKSHLQAEFEARELFKELHLGSEHINEKAWQDPVNYMVDLARDKNLAILELKGEYDLTDVQDDIFQVHLGWIKGLKEVGYKNFVLEPKIYLESIFDWCYEKKDYKSLEELSEIFLKELSKSNPDFRDVLDFPNEGVSESIDSSIRFLEKLHEIKDVNIQFLHLNEFVGNRPLNQWIKENGDKKLAAIIYETDDSIHKSKNAVLVKHSLGASEYDDINTMSSDQLIGKAVNRISMSKPPGANNTVALKINGNKPLINQIKSITEENPENDEDLSYLYKFVDNGRVMTSWRYRDAYLVTVINDEDDSESFSSAPSNQTPVLV